jgi:hypothetical protein
MGGACGTFGGEEKYVQGLVGESEGNRPLVRPRHRWEGDIKIDLKEIGWKGADWIIVVEGRDKWGFLGTR